MKKIALRITLIELLLVVSILGVVAAICCGGAQNIFYYSKAEVFVAEVIRKYEKHGGGEHVTTVYRVDVRRPGKKFIETLECRDDLLHGKFDSATVYANLLEHEFYEFDIRGIRSEAWSMFPNIITATSAEKPKAEIDY